MSGGILCIFCLVSVQPVPVIAGCIQVTCYCDVHVPCGSSNEDCIRACGDEVPPTQPPSPGAGTPTQQKPTYDAEEKKKQRERYRQRYEAEMERRRQAALEEKKREEERRKKFELDKQKALDLLKSGSKSLGLKKDTGTSLKLKGAPPDSPKLKSGQYKEPIFTKGYKGSAPVDLRDINSGSDQALPLQKIVPEKGVIFREVPSPSGYKSKPERRALAAALSDEHLHKAIERTSYLLAQMKGEFLGKRGKLNHLLKETQDSEREAVSTSLDLLTAQLIDALPENSPFAKDIKLVIDRANKIKGHHKALKTRAYLEIGRSIVLDAYDTLADHSDAFTKKGGKLVSKVGASSVALASFAVDYTYQVMRWAVTRQQMLMIIDNMDESNGELKAQKTLSRLHEDLVEERARRNATQ